MNILRRKMWSWSTASLLLIIILYIIITYYIVIVRIITGREKRTNQMNANLGSLIRQPITSQSFWYA
jgi:hypothetical protein